MSVFSIVRANVAAGAAEDAQEFLRWWADEHQPEYVAMDGFRRAWLLERVDHPHAHGEQGQAFTAVYEVDAIDDFHRALDAGPPWGPWQRYVDEWLVDWTRTYRAKTTEQAKDERAGAHWAVVAADFELETAAERRRFDAWYDERHLPELLANPGFHRAWRMRLTPHEGDLGARGHTFWAVYEVDSPDHFAAARQRRLEAGVEPWDGIWGERLRDWSISFHRVRNRVADEVTG